MKIKISRKFDPPTLTLILMFICGSLENFFGVPSVIYFLIDIPIILMILGKRNVFDRKRLKEYNANFFLYVTFLMIVIQVLYNIVTMSVSLNLIYGIYRYFRGVLFFICCLTYLSFDSIRKTIGFIKIIFCLNVVIYVFQFVILGIRQDYLNGIFGVRSGNNAYIELFFLIITIYCFVGYFYGKYSIRQVLPCICIVFLFMAASEIKFYFFQAALMVVVSFFLKMNRLRNWVRIFVCTAALIVGYRLLIYLYPHFASLFGEILNMGFSRLINLQRHYSTDYDIGRGVFIKRINEQFFVSWHHPFLGLGLGACTSSRFVDNSFSALYSVTHYNQFLTAYTYMEQGIIGFVLFMSMLIYPSILGVKEVIQNRKTMYSCFLIQIGVVGVTLFYYNMVLYSQYCFLYFWTMSAIFYLRKNDIDGNCELFKM